MLLTLVKLEETVVTLGDKGDVRWTNGPVVDGGNGTANKYFTMIKYRAKLLTKRLHMANGLR